MLSSTRHSHSRSHRQERKPLMDSVLPGPMWLRSRSSERPARARDSYEIYSSSQLHQCRQEVYDFLLQHTTETREYLEELNYTEKRKKRHMVDYFTEQADMLLEKLKREMQSDEAIIEEDFIKKEPEEKLIAEWELFETHSPESKKPRNSQIEPYEIGELSPSHSINEERPSEKRHRERKEIKRGSNEKLSPEERRQMMDKHPINALLELAMSRKWPEPEFQSISKYDRHSGPKPLFKFRVYFRGRHYEPREPAHNKKTARAEAAAYCVSELLKTL